MLSKVCPTSLTVRSFAIGSMEPGLQTPDRSIVHGALYQALGQILSLKRLLNSSIADETTFYVNTTLIIVEPKMLGCQILKVHVKMRVIWLDQKTQIRNVYPFLNVFIENPLQSAQSAITWQLNPHTNHLIPKFTGHEHFQIVRWIRTARSESFEILLI